MKVFKEKKGLKISDLTRITGIPKSTIHYYVSMGLLPAPVKTSHNMAYYDEKCVEMINLIKELQSRKFIPLEHIKHLLNHFTGDNVPAQLLINTHKLIFDFKSPNEKYLTLPQYLKKTGLSEQNVTRALECNMLIPSGTEKTPFDSDDVRTGILLKRLLDIGINLEDLVYYPQMISGIVDKDIDLHDKVTDIFAKLDNVKFFNVTEMMIEAAGSAREYFFKRIFQKKLLEHMNDKNEKNCINRMGRRNDE